MGVSDRDFWGFGMVDFLRVRSAFFAKNGLDDEGVDLSKPSWSRYEELNKEIYEAWNK